MSNISLPLIHASTKDKSSVDNKDTSHLTLSSTAPSVQHKLSPGGKWDGRYEGALDENSIHTTSTSTVSTSMESASLELDDEDDDKCETHRRRRHDSKSQTKQGRTIPVSVPRALECPPSFEQLVEKWIHQESTIGRYNQSVSQSYRAMGDWCLHAANLPARSIILHRASYRIDMFLYGASTNGSFAPTFQQALTDRGLVESDYSSIQHHLAESVHFEMNGDMLRQLGMAQLAAHEYQKAIKVEEAAFGRENPCLATLWRKLACLVAIIRADRTYHNWAHEIDDMDRLDDGWLQRHTKVHDHGNPMNEERHSGFIPSKVCRALRRGDDYYKALEFSQAVGRYSHAVTINRHRRSRSKSNGKHNRSSRSRSRSNDTRIDTKLESKSPHETKSPRCGKRDIKPRKSVEYVDKEEPMKELEMLLSSSAIRTDKLVKSPAPTSKSKDVSDKKQEKLASHQTIISTSKRIKSSLIPNSSSRSMNKGHLLHYLEPPRPKSDSHVAKLARKVASKASRQIRKTIAMSGGGGGGGSSSNWQGRGYASNLWFLCLPGVSSNDALG
jgi:hypothetical protein